MCDCSRHSLPRLDRQSCRFHIYSLKDDRFLPRLSKLFFDKRDFGQTNEQQRHFNEQPTRELHGEVDSIQTNLKLFLPPRIIKMSSLSLSFIACAGLPFHVIGEVSREPEARQVCVGPQVGPYRKCCHVVTNPTVYNRSIYKYNLINVYKYNLIDACISVFLESLGRIFMLAIFMHGNLV